MIKELVMRNQPRRYLVCNEKHIVMVTYEKHIADEIERHLKENNYKFDTFPLITKR